MALFLDLKVAGNLYIEKGQVIQKGVVTLFQAKIWWLCFLVEGEQDKIILSKNKLKNTCFIDLWFVF